MKQLNLFEDCVPKKISKKNKDTVQWKLFIDGASRKNPGLAGAGVYLLKNEEVVFQQGFFLGEKTNNQAEYYALLLGIFYTKKFIDVAHDHIFIFSDSELLVRQFKGEYRIKNAALKILFDLAMKLLENVSYSFCHIVRMYNEQADFWANEGIRKKVPLPQDFKKFLQQHEVYI